MITGGGAWTTALNAETKRALYILSIPGKSLTLACFLSTIQSTSDAGSGRAADFATPGAGSTTLTSATFGFQPWMIGYFITITAGTNFVAGSYKISNWNSTTSVVLASSPTPGGAGSIGAGSLQMITGGAALKPILDVPKGASQKIDELNAHSSISNLPLTTIDPDGTVGTLSADTTAIGQVVSFKMGFPGLDLSDFVTIHTGTISEIGRTKEGRFTINVQDLLLNLVNQIFLNGGAASWTDLATSGANATTVTSALGIFEPWMVGRTLKINSGTNFIAGSYAILAWNSRTSITLLTSPSTAGAGSVGIGVIAFVAGETPATAPPKDPAVLDNGSPVSKDNPRYFQGNTIDLILAALQNELGVGQATPPVLVPSTYGGNGTGQSGFVINPSWTFYNVNDGATLFNPNTYVDVPALLALKTGQFAGDRQLFAYESPQSGLGWIESQLLRTSGIYWITKANGQLSPKTMKHPSSVSSTAISDHQIVGIPETVRWPIINMIDCTIPADDSGNTITLTFAQQSSLNTYKGPYTHSINSDGLRLSLGALTKLFLVCNRIFNRHAFSTPEYTITTTLKNFVLELGDFISLTHPRLFDLKSGTVGVTSVLCEITERQPDYVNGRITFKAIDTRFISTSTGAFEVAAAADAIPAWAGASGPQRAQYMFVSKNDGTMSDGSAANEID